VNAVHLERRVAFPSRSFCRFGRCPCYYASQDGPLAARTSSTGSVRANTSIHHGSATICSPRVHATFKLPGSGGSQSRGRLMRENKLSTRFRRRFRTTTDSKHGSRAAARMCWTQLHRASSQQSWGDRHNISVSSKAGCTSQSFSILVLGGFVGWRPVGFDSPPRARALAWPCPRQPDRAGSPLGSEHTYAARTTAKPGILKHKCQHEPERRLWTIRGRELLRVPKRNWRHRRLNSRRQQHLRLAIHEGFYILVAVIRRSTTTAESNLAYAFS